MGLLCNESWANFQDCDTIDWDNFFRKGSGMSIFPRDVLVLNKESPLRTTVNNVVDLENQMSTEDLLKEVDLIQKSVRIQPS